VAIIAMFDATGATAQKYEETVRRLTDMGLGAPEGRLYHVCYGNKDSLQVIEVFESPADLEAFGAKLMPLLQEIGIQATPTVLEVHNIVQK
jgi:hypothetical protein